jgi:hypothetical protein
MNSHTGLQARIHDYEEQRRRDHDEETLRISDADEEQNDLDALEALAETDIDTDVEEDDMIRPNSPRKEREKYNAYDSRSQLWIL